MEVHCEVLDWFIISARIVNSRGTISAGVQLRSLKRDIGRQVAGDRIVNIRQPL